MSAERYVRENVMSSQLLKALSDKAPLALLPRDGISKNFNSTKQFKVILGCKAEWSNPMLDLLLRNSAIKRYTDGSETSESISAIHTHGTFSKHLINRCFCYKSVCRNKSVFGNANFAICIMQRNSERQTLAKIERSKNHHCRSRYAETRKTCNI